MITSTLTGKRFFYDYVFGMDTNTHDLYSQMGVPIIESAMDGYNGTCRFAPHAQKRCTRETGQIPTHV